MIFGDVLTQVYRLLEDPGQFAWPNSAVALHLQDAVREVANRVGRAEGRGTLGLVQGQQSYVLPVGIKRVKNVRILPEIQAGGTQAEAGMSLQEVPLEEMPIVVLQEADPRVFSTSAVAGATEEQLELFMWPAPARSTADAIVYNYDIEYAFASVDPADAGNLAQLIPFPAQYDKIILYLTCAGLLSERTDQDEMRKGELFQFKAEEILRPLIPIRPTSYMRDVYRAFP